MGAEFVADLVSGGGSDQTDLSEFRITFDGRWRSPPQSADGSLAVLITPDQANALADWIKDTLASLRRGR
jgi:hypothetical protein